MRAVIIEDSPAQADHLTSVLQDAGFAVQVGHDGETGRRGDARH
jgi:DNA-binding response OmpR family regulator